MQIFVANVNYKDVKMLLISIRSIIIRSFRCDKFLEVLKLISLIYNPNRSSNKENEAPEPHHDNHELLSARIGITASSATAQCESSLRNPDIGNFNIEFNISSNDASDEDMFD